MRILYLSPRKCWPINSGARLRDYYLASQLAKRAQVTYWAVCYPEQEKQQRSELAAPETIFEELRILEEARPFTALNLIRGLAGPDPVTVLNWTSPVVAEALAALGRERQFDTIQAEGVHLIKYLPVLREFSGHPPVVCDWHDILSEQMERYGDAQSLPRKLYARRTASLLRNAETVMLRSCDAHTVVSDRDRMRLRGYAPRASMSIVENGVDTAYFDEVRRAGGGGGADSGAARGGDAAAGGGGAGATAASGGATRGVAASGGRDPARSRVLFVGAMDYYANIEAAVRFAREEWPALRKRFGDLRFTIVGRKPVAEVRALASDEMGIEVTGTVADVRPYYREACAVVVPLRAGSGTRLKILEAMAAGVPVISTTIGAEGLEAVDGEEILIANTTAETVEAVVRLRRDSGLREGLIARGLLLVTRRYDWGILGERLFGIHQNLAGAK